jgi:hypothetical protein
VATEDRFGVWSAKFIGVHDGDRIVVDGKAGGAYGHTRTINHGTDNVTGQEDKLEVVQVRKRHRPRLRKKINWSRLSKRHFAGHYVKSRRGGVHGGIIGWRSGRAFCGSRCIDAMDHLGRRTMLTVDANILAISVTGENRSVIWLIVEAVLTRATILAHKGSRSLWRTQPEMY